ncbi:putative porin [Candidatus Termititenax aidoneus]|uniref:Porin n=1 Tax=Termititenax aidoneus TaxID=2218524 RepID=A0A388T7P8_TERA1|nr:putative porin [Candidatus Termititenax aidoneus]
MRKRILKFVLLGALLGQALWAANGLLEPSVLQTDDSPATQEDVAALRSDIQQVRDEFQRKYDLNTAATGRSLRISGIVQTKLTVPAQVTLNTYNSFHVPLATLTFRGSLKKDYDDWRNLDYVVSVGGGNPGAPQFLDAYLNYNILPANQSDSARLAVSFGQQTKPFGLEASALEDKKPVINQAQFVAPLGFVLRDVGLVFKGDIFPANDFGYGYRVPLLEYSAGVLNGNGFNQGGNNKDKFDTLYRLIINPIAWDIGDGQINYNDWLRGLSIGASVYDGSSRLGVTDNQVVTGVKTRTGFDVAYVRNPIGFTYEVVNGEDERVSGSVDVTNKIKSAGSTFTLFLEFGEQFVNGYRNQSRNDDWWPLTWQPFYRIDNWNPNTEEKKNNIEIQTLGLNIFFAETTKFQINHNVKNYYEPADADGDRDAARSAETVVQFQFGF